MRLLLTRAAADATRSRRALEARGHSVIVSPLIEIVATGAAWPGGDVDALVATSAQAFDVRPDLPIERRDLLPLLLVGQRTLEAARAQGFAGPTTCEPDVAALIATLVAKEGPNMRLVYLAGRDRKPDLEDAIAGHGHRLEIVEAYVARATEGLSSEAVAAFQTGALDGIVHFSRRSAGLFVAAAEKAGVDATSPFHLCLSADVATPLRAAGCVAVKIAKAPNEAALFSLLDV